jgi:hypothetical protein
MPGRRIDFLPIATGGGATVDTQAAFVGSNYQVNGFQNGLALPNQFNKAWRQGSVMSAALATFISDQLDVDVLDDGNLPNLITILKNALRGATSKILVVPYAAGAVFDASLSNKFETTLTGDMTPTLINTTPGQKILFIIHQDGVGNHLFNPPSNLPLDPISGAANVTNRQDFDVLSNGSLFPASGMISQ